MYERKTSTTVLELPIETKERLLRYVAQLNVEKKPDAPKITMVGFTTELLNRHLPQEDTARPEAQEATE